MLSSASSKNGSDTWRRAARISAITRSTGFWLKREVIRRLAAQNSQARGQPREVWTVIRLYARPSRKSNRGAA